MTTQNGNNPLTPAAPGTTMNLHELARQAEASKQIEPRIALMEAEMERTRRDGIWGLMYLRYEAWLEQKMQGPAIAKL